jgi:undecaprenyl-diphosphatase
VHVLVAHAGGQSFPSDHATAAFGVAVAVFAFLSRRWGTGLLAAAALIGFARVYDGIHYPGDVAGSLLVALLGTAIVAAAWQATSRRVA